MNEPPVAPYLVVDDPQQLKAFTDPLRVRVLDILVARAATNQQVAKALDQPQAKALYHIRFLLDCGLIRLVEQRIRGGNVEKYYRAIARSFGLRPPARVPHGELGADAESVQQQMFASLDRWPGQGDLETRRARLSDERLRQFRRRLDELLAEFWDEPAAQDAGAPARTLATFVYRDPQDDS